MSLVLQTSQGFLLSGVGGTWEVLSRPLIKPICVNATKALCSPASSGWEGGKGWEGREEPPKSLYRAQPPGRKKPGLLIIRMSRGELGT